MPAIAIRAAEYRRPLFGPQDGLFWRCLLTTSIAGIVFVLVMMFVPRPPVVHVIELSPRVTKLIFDKPKPVAPVAAQAVIVPEPGAPAPKGPATPEPLPRARRPEAIKPLAPDAGLVGRERAREMVSSTLASASPTLERSLDGLSSSLRSTSTDVVRPSGGRRARGVRSGSDGRVAGLGSGLSTGSGGADLSGSGVKGSLVSIGSLSGVGVGRGGVPSGEAGGTGSGGRGNNLGAYRSNASLLAVIQKYAAGIQYCYSNELKHSPGLSGKLVVTLVVAASGEVTNATVIQNSVGSSQLESCALSQIRDWKFPAIPAGVTTFQAPFVFTPPE